MSQSQRFDSQCEEPFPRPSAVGPVVTQNPRVATLVLMVGLPAAGKTTRAKELAATHRALRLTPDHWMIPLFGDPMADGKRWVLEGRLDLSRPSGTSTGDQRRARLRALGPR